MPFPPLSLQTPAEVAGQIAQRAKTLRLAQGWTRRTLAARAGINAETLKRFESTGQISLARLLQLALALGRLAEFEPLLLPPSVRSIDELEQRGATKIPKRGRR